METKPEVFSPAEIEEERDELAADEADGDRAAALPRFGQLRWLATVDALRLALAQSQLRILALDDAVEKREALVAAALRLHDACEGYNQSATEGEALVAVAKALIDIGALSEERLARSRAQRIVAEARDEALREALEALLACRSKLKAADVRDGTPANMPCHEYTMAGEAAANIESALAAKP